MKRPNILFFFTDQQRADTCGCYGQPLPVTPNLDALAKRGVLFENAFTPQPVCGPCRAIFQTGLYPTRTGCFRNAIALPLDANTIARRMSRAGYEVGYAGKWHLASGEAHYETSAVPKAYRGGYDGFWRAADVLEFTSHGYGGYVFDENGEKRAFENYRADAITDFALEFFDSRDRSRPFFLTISYIEPHHQNDRGHYEGPEGSKQRFGGYTLPGDLEALGGNAREEYPDYLGQCASLDENLGRVIERLRREGVLEDTLIVYASDHGSHFQTRNLDAHKNGEDDYKRSCHDACLRVPLVLAGPGFEGGRRVSAVTSTVNLPKTLALEAGADASGMDGESLKEVAQGNAARDYAFAQISESRVGRCVRERDWLYAVYAPGLSGWTHPDSPVYADDFLYDLKNDPDELDNLAGRAAYDGVRDGLRAKLARAMVEAGEAAPRFV